MDLAGLLFLDSDYLDCATRSCELILSMMDSSPCKDNDKYKELKKLISVLTHTGEKVLDPPVLKGITRICKLSNDFIIHAYNLLMGHLEANHSEVRFSCFQLCIELFRRSHCFRELIVSNLEQLMILTAETNPSKPLPPPRSTALSLKKLALTTIRDWAREYGSGYKKLQLGISFLKNCKRVDLNAMALEEAAEQSRQEELKRRKVGLQNQRFKRIVEEMKDIQSEIINAVTEMENCLSLLLPRPEDFFIDSGGGDAVSAEEETMKKPHSQCPDDQNHSVEMSEESCVSDNDLEESSVSSNPIFDFRKYGIINPHFSITLKVDPGNEPLLKKTEENSPIFENAQDLFKVVSNRYYPCVLKWETVLEKCSDLETSVTHETSKKINDLKSRTEIILDKYNRLNLQAFNGKNAGTESDDCDTSDSDFEEVQNKDGFEAYSRSSAVNISVKDQLEAGPSNQSTSKVTGSKKDWSLVSEENHEKDPTSILSTLSTLSSKACSTSKEKPKSCKDTSLSKHNKEIPVMNMSGPKDCELSQEPGPSNRDQRKAKLLSIAPKLPFDVDLYHWEDEKVEAPTRMIVKPDAHRFWVSSAEDRDEMRDPDGDACLRTRVIEFTGDFEKVKWTCRAPLTNGKLCPRQDRVKCPFHGKIIARDESGKPSNPDDEVAEEKRLEAEKGNEVPDWQDPKLLAELKESTGVDLRMPDKSKRGWRKHIPGEEKKYVGLTDIKASHNTTYSRLSKKVFQKSSMKRVAADLDKLDRRRFRDKYGDQFNYVFDR